MAKRQIVTLLTDFGTGDPYVAAMKGVLLTRCPAAQIVDISHEIPAQDVLAGAFVLAQAAQYFPADTLHVGVVDPGVGTDRRVLAARFGGQTFLVPDNGLITFVAERMEAQAIVAVSNTRFLPPGKASMTFHGRDIFAPVAGEILNGLDIRQLGPEPKSYKVLDVPRAVMDRSQVLGQVIYVDRFGNLVTNIPQAGLSEVFTDLEAVSVRCAGREVGPLRGTYGFVPPGEPLALLNSMGLLEVAVNRGRAADILGAGVGAEVRVTGR